MSTYDEMAPLKLPVSTTETIPGRSVTGYVGPAFGVVAQSVGLARGFKGLIKAFRRGEVKEFSDTLEAARHRSVERMIEQAIALGADAVVAMRFDSGEVGGQGGMAEIVAYGTTVTLD